MDLRHWQQFNNKEALNHILDFFEDLTVPCPMHTSQLTGAMYIQEYLEGHLDCWDESSSWNFNTFNAFARHRDHNLHKVSLKISVEEHWLTCFMYYLQI